MNFTDACDLLEGNSNIAIRKVPNPAQPNSKAEDARRIWNAATSIVGTPADVYLARRGIPLSRIALQPNLRFAKLKFDGSEALHPALVAAVRDVRGEITGIQRTYLTEEGEKLCVDAKRSLGTIRGGAIRLSSGGDEDDLGAIYLCEGLEDGLSLLRLQGDAPVWVAAGAGMMEAVKLPATTTNVRIVPDNDFAGRSAALRAGVKFTKQGVFVHLNRLPDEFKDYNEFLLHHLASPVSPEADPGEESGA
ncbi:DUF7146 domain-containing protein [Sphingomonas aerophila]|uniref:DNA primase n=1 Tax=Sphingomonas aerophila TaxID=1344948 RepID=A0A7W9BGT4_9SPHN|nr:DNA primase [Sphingomonas aerophila]